jgi:hypothetical protein
MLINVTEEHIANGCRNSHCGCPVALAVGEVITNKARVSVGTSVWSLRDKDRNVLHKGDLPLDARNRICAFDHNHKMDTFTFELDIPKELLKEPLT